MKNAVIIKGNRYGISVVLNEDVEFSQLLAELETRLEKAEPFFDSERQLAVTFEGRSLTNDELDQILSVIKNNSKLNIQYVMDDNSELETTFFDIIQAAKTQEIEEEEIEEEIAAPLESSTQEHTYAPVKEERPISREADTSSEHNGLFYKGTLRSGQTLEAKDSLVIIGDVNPGAKVIAGGNIVIIGDLKGSVIAGANGNPHAFVMALSMNPIQIQISDIISRSPDVREKKQKGDAKIATIVNEQICIESISKAAIQDIDL